MTPVSQHFQHMHRPLALSDNSAAQGPVVQRVDNTIPRPSHREISRKIAILTIFPEIFEKSSKLK